MTTGRDSAGRLKMHGMDQVTLANYKKDPFSPNIVRAVAAIMEKEDVATPVDVMMQMRRIKKENYEHWRFGRVRYLEEVSVGNLSKANRILRILRMHAHDLNLIPSQTVYRKWGKGKTVVLRFSKSGDPHIEEPYARHFLVPTKGKKRQKAQGSV